jgi:(p)ppGpp synthase/HD superfamily hydrolase
MTKNLDIQFEKAVRLLVEYLPVSDKKSRKPILFHDIRVGIYLYNQGYSENIVLAGVLHDLIEWSDIDEKIIIDKFGEKVFKLIVASTKDVSIEKNIRNEELIKRCVDNGQDALIVKTADIIDSYKWYESQKNEDQLINHCVKNSKLIFKYKPENFKDKIFIELKNLEQKINKKYKNTNY